MDLGYWTQIPDARRSRHQSSFRTEPGEYWFDRHERRYAYAYAHIQELRQWCQERGLIIFTAEFGYRVNIQFPKELRPFCYWWPANAKLVFDQQLEEGVHCHDIWQLIGELTDYLQHRRERKVNLFKLAKNR